MAVSTLSLGFNSIIGIDTGSNDGTFSSSANLGGWTTANLTLRRTNPDSTNVDTSGHEGKEYGLKGCSLTFEALDDQANDTVQDQLLADFWAGTKRWFRIEPRDGVGYLEVIFRCVIGQAAWVKEQGGIVRFNFSGDSDGTITVQDQ